MPNPTDIESHYSLYKHLQHLLAEDPKLKMVNLHGGLDIWIYKNTTKVVEAAGAARDAQKLCTADPNNSNCAFVLREIVRMLGYLDGRQYVRIDVPPTLKLDPVVPPVALLEFDPVNQQPPGYLEHIGSIHLKLMLSSPGVTPNQRTLANQIIQEINNVQVWLKAVHDDAVQLVNMNNPQLSQPGAFLILDNLLMQATYALIGKYDPNTGMTMDGFAA